jgi:class 3 adenylate cyclase
MGLRTDLNSEVKEVFSAPWDESKAQVVPDPEDLKLSNDARHFERATMFYADLAGSTDLVDSHSWSFAGEIYKTYLLCAAKLVRALGGVITAYDGDRIMAVFIGGQQTSNAAKCALQLNWAVLNIVNPAAQKVYDNGYSIKQVVGIDTSEIRAARIGVRGGNDLVWIGRAANYAAKLTECSDSYSTWITEDAYGYLLDFSKYGGDPKSNMWTKFTWDKMDGIAIYGSKWWWEVPD